MSHKNEAIQKLLEDRYYRRDEKGNLLEKSPDEMFARIAVAVAKAETGHDNILGSAESYWQDRFFKLMLDNKFLPNTPTLINAGKGKGTLSGCFVLPVPDSMDGIFEAVKQSAMIMKSGGGIGYNFGHLREEGSIVKSTGQQSGGPLSFMKSFDAMCDTVKQGGSRRGAMMGVLPVWHPDIEKFIEMKADGVSFSNFNISVGITDAFMHCVQQNLVWSLHTPSDYYGTESGPFKKQIYARELWQKIVDQAWKTGDPGLVFLDTINKAHPLDEEIESTNPCWSGSTKVWTVEHGWITFRELEKLGDTEVFSWNGSKIVTKMLRNPRKTADNTRIVEVAVRGSGAKAGQISYLRCTYNHQFYLKDGTKVEAKDLKPGDSLLSVYLYNANSKGYVSASCNGDSELVHNIVMQTPEGFHAHHINEITSDNKRSNLELRPIHDHLSDHKKGEKNPIHKLTAEGKNYLLTLPTDGKNNGRYRQDISNVEIVNLRDEDGLSWKKICKQVGLAPNVLTAKKRYALGVQELTEWRDAGNHTVISVEDCAFDSVYNGTVDDTHNYFVQCGDRLDQHPDGILSANCGEIPLRPYESCNLGSINLMEYVKFPAPLSGKPAEWYLDWDELEEDIPTMVRFLDDIIDINPFPLPEIKKATEEARKIGLGVMGWADVLIMMEIPYDSQEALDLAEKLMQFIKMTATIASDKLGQEKGTFPLNEENGLEGFRRNATLLCVAPTGTLSRIAGVSSGIEPNFAWETHHKLEGHEYDETHWAYKDYLNNTLSIDYGHDISMPSYMKTANEIPFMWHLAMQAAFQKHIDNSVSKTINLDASATVDDVYDIYLEAYKLGLKGITIYRDGSKDNQPLNKIITLDSYKDPRFPVTDEAIINQPSPLEEVVKQQLRKRGSVTVGPTYKIDTTKGKAYITVNYSEYHQQPVEIFIRLGHLATPQEQSYADYIGRLISVMLKYSIPIDRIQKQGNKVYSDCVFWYNKRSFQSIPMLLSYLVGFTFEEGMKMADIDIDSMMDSGYEEDEFCSTERLFDHCYECGMDTVVNEGGCKICTNCYAEHCGG